jgi:hypothetical protein
MSAAAVPPKPPGHHRVKTEIYLDPDISFDELAVTSPKAALYTPQKEMWKAKGKGKPLDTVAWSFAQNE